jgi:hypothetical protein
MKRLPTLFEPHADPQRPAPPHHNRPGVCYLLVKGCCGNPAAFGVPGCCACEGDRPDYNACMTPCTREQYAAAAAAHPELMGMYASGFLAEPGPFEDRRTWQALAQQLEGKTS